jgi:ubiquinone/menaquinone biosynthesis C-methylase UbiE
MTPHPPANYGRLAKSYKFWEYLVFGRQLRRCREAWWKALLNTQEALILGDGDGRFSTFLLENHPTVKITSLDVSLPMLNQAEKRREKRNIQENRVTTILSDVNSWDYGNKKFDAVVTHFFMDSFETLEMKTIATTIKNVLKPGRQLHVSDFHIPKDPKFGRWRARLTLGFLYPIFRVITNLRTRSLVDYKSILISQGFGLIKETYFSQNVLVAQIYQYEGEP